MIPQKVKEHLEEYINQEVYVQVAIIKGKEKGSTKSAIDKYGHQPAAPTQKVCGYSLTLVHFWEKLNLHSSKIKN